jgi:subtilisin-like proprotein convertase family protein
MSRITRFHLTMIVVILAATAALAVSSGFPDGGDKAAPVRIAVTDPETLRTALSLGGQVVEDYGAFQYVDVHAGALAEPALAAAVPGADAFTIELNVGPINTRITPSHTLSATAAADPTKRLHLVQFAGPIKPEWREALIKQGLQVVTYIPNNAYLVYGTGAQRAAITTVVAKVAPVQWSGEFLPEHRISPRIAAEMGKQAKAAAEPRLFAIQMVEDADANLATMAIINRLAVEPPLRDSRLLGYRNVIVRLPVSAVDELAKQPEVVSIAPYVMPTKGCERQNQIVAGNLAGNAPSGPGYLAWLAGKGFTQAQFDASNFVVDVGDSGIDNGTNSPNHFGLWRSGETTGTSRVAYARLEGTPNPGSTIQGCDGHGTINAHIVAGYNNLSGFPHADASGYRYGLGVAPFVKVGSSTVFDPDTFTSPNYANMLSRAYNDGARISTNSWGAAIAGEYNVDSQAYDALVRDAQPSSSAIPVAGNQEMVIVFANGNDGPGAQTVGSPATAKNVISVGAAEGVQAFGGADGCGVSDSGADSANDIIDFSSRGPCKDGRMKPDIVAPGTHISGGVAQQASPGPNGTALACFNASGVCGGPSSNNFFPSGQQFYTASSGTSHATPAVAGGCALLRQYFINLGFAAPSPAMTKAFLANVARYMTGTGANDTLWSNNQGMGMMDLGRAFDGTARILSDQDAGLKFTATGQTRNWTVSIPDSTKPFRVTLAWTDAPGNTVGAAYNNDLDLTVYHGGAVYRGNVFSGATSAQGGAYDPRNNMESVFLPAGTTGTAVVRVTAKNINSDGVPNASPSVDQDFALVIYNAVAASAAVPAAVSTALVSESCRPGNLVLDPNETAEVSLTIENPGNATGTNIEAALVASANVVPKSPMQSYGNLAAGASASRTFRFRALGNPGQEIHVGFLIRQNGSPLGTATFTYRLCTLVSQTFSYTGPAVAIPDNNPTGVNVSLPVSGFVGTIAKMQFRFDGTACSAVAGDTNVGLDHTWVGDLIVTLQSPQGTVVTLINRPGAGPIGSRGNNFCQTLLDDDGSVSIQDITDLSAPYTGTYRPNAPLSAFNGQNPNGTWTLNVSDRASGDAGNVRRFSLLFYSYECCPSITVTDEDGFDSDPSQPPGSSTGWSIFGMNTPSFAFGQYAGGTSSLQSVVASDATRFRISGWLANQAEWLPYASVGANNYVRGKFYLFAGGQSNPAEQNQIPCLRARLSNRFAVNSMLEVFGHLNSDPGSFAHYAELRPSNVSTSPSLYRVDMDPIDVPYLVANGATEGILRGFETYALDPQDNGYIALAESVIGTYPASLTSTSTAANQTYTTGGASAGDLALVDPILFSALALIPSAGEGVYSTDDPNPSTPRPTHSAGVFGVTLSSVAVPTNRIGVGAREIYPGPNPAVYPRVEENKQYHVRWHLTSLQYSNRNAAIRLRARSAKFGWSQKKEIGGAWATGSSVLNENNSIAQQALPGIGTQNPDKYTTDTLGGWYTLIMHTPMSTDIRPEFAPGTPLAMRMPLMVAEPGPGSGSNSRRDIRFGFDLVDTLSGGTNKNLEEGHVTLDRIEVRSYSLVSD